jgi:hypothetical protein
VSWWAEEAITDEQAARAVAGGPADVLIAHDCPAGVLIPGIDDRTLSEAPFPAFELLRAGEHRQVLRRVVDAVRPAQIWHGHYHRAYTAVADLGYGDVQVVGLDCDGSTLHGNVRAIDLDELRPAGGS